MEQEIYGDTNFKWCDRYSLQGIGTKTVAFGNKRTSGDNPNYGNF